MGARALDGVRVIDVTIMLAGTYASRLLADMGAEVIKVESIYRYDPTRGPVTGDPGARAYPDNDPGERPYNRSSYYNEVNRNKLGVTIDLSKPEGVALFKRLVSIGDVVLNNFSARVMKNLGLDYPVLREIKQDIIFASMPAFGLTGPEKDFVAYGPTIEMLSGMVELSGYPDGLPMVSGITYGDPVAGAHATFAILTALRHRRQTGQGQSIDLSQLETMVPLIGEYVMDYAMNRRVGTRMANRHDSMAPQGVYPSAGDDNWIAIAVASDEEWRALCAAMGKPELASDKRFADAISRYQLQDELDSIIESWTKSLDHLEAMQILQKAGVRAGAVLNADEVAQNPHFQARGYFETVTHPDAGTHAYPGPAFDLSATPPSIRIPAPTLGQHNNLVFGEMLGLSGKEIADLEEKGIIGTVPAEQP